MAEALSGFCRDCFSRLPEAASAHVRCPACRSPRIVAHAEIFTLEIAHLDCDAFYAAIEKRDDPTLKGKPVIVGGGARGVVATCCYIARTYGVHSAMPMFQALRACPAAVVIPPDMKKYAAVGEEIRALMRELTPLVEPISIDEAFLDLSGTERLHGRSPAETVARLARHVEREIGVTLSVGLSYNKFLAKLASDFDKPRGFTVIGRTEARTLLAGLPVGKLWGVGRAFRDRLAKDGFHTIGELQRVDEATLVSRYGAMGSRLARFSQGQDTRSVTPASIRKSVSAETTFASDHAAFDVLDRHLWTLAEKVADRLKRSGIAGQTVTLKLKTARHRTITRSHTLPDPTQLANVIHGVARALLAKEATGTSFRLVGVGVSGLTGADAADPPSLADPKSLGLAAAERAMDQVRRKFGESAIRKGRGFDGRPR